MKLPTPLKHLLGIGICSLLMFGILLGVFFMSMITFHPGPASEVRPFTKTEVWLAETGGAIFQVFYWPVSQLRLEKASLYVLSLLYGTLFYLFCLVIRHQYRKFAKTSG